MSKHKLDKEEQKLLASVEKGEWAPVKNMKVMIDKYAEYAKNTLKKDQRISIRISKQDLIGIQSKAVGEGIPYQTLVTTALCN